VGIIEALVTPHSRFTDASGTSEMIIGGLSTVAAAGISVVIGVLAFLITQSYTTGMAGAAWQNGITTLADGSASFREDAGRLLAAMALIALAGIVLGLLTLGLGWFVVLFFAIYVVPAVVLDNLGALPAFRLSVRIATRRLVSTIIIVVMLLVMWLVAGLLTLPFAIIPFLGPVVLAIATQAVTAYATLVIVGEYLSARRAPEIVSPGPPLE
jgi:hypothetical protein